MLQELQIFPNHATVDEVFHFSDYVFATKYFDARIACVLLLHVVLLEACRGCD